MDTLTRKLHDRLALRVTDLIGHGGGLKRIRAFVGYLVGGPLLRDIIVDGLESEENLAEHVSCLRSMLRRRGRMLDKVRAAVGGGIDG